ncbi:hypothetical protein CEV32_4961 [Brucella rhizosphaerae]|uniref:Uncharacterized protein n=1 Tax=Brucella rhizosphaerae TaxID=571254 RepID=A0A256FX75_9HYPH|nr:hypothetical protein CEV32_4961 [Brucella rhizosphaerae]
MILLNRVVHIFAGANGNGLANLRKTVFCIALQDSCSIGLTAIDGDPFWSAMVGQSLAKKAFGCS